jgi:pimeloyl-ACP methyl ester carboxylesterase
LGYENFSFLGWSDGAKVALIMAVNHPNFIKSIILCGIITFPKEKKYKKYIIHKKTSINGAEK